MKPGMIVMRFLCKHRMTVVAVFDGIVWCTYMHHGKKFTEYHMANQLFKVA